MVKIGAMSIRQEISGALRQAVKTQDRLATSTLRLVIAALKDHEIASRANGVSQMVSDEQAIGILAKMVRQRREAAEQFREGNRTDLADREEAEISIITRFMPRPMDPEELARCVDAAIVECDALSLKDMGRVMALLKTSYPGRFDGAAASALVRKRLG